MKNAIQVLRKNGFKVKVTHLRRDIIGKNYYPRHYFGKGKFPLEYMNNYGGQTFVSVISPDNRIFSGATRCSNKDMFVKKNGVSLAMQRCIVQMKTANVKLPLEELDFLAGLQ